MDTHWLKLDRLELNQSLEIPKIPWWFNFANSIWWSTVSKAFCKSTKTPQSILAVEYEYDYDYILLVLMNQRMFNKSSREQGVYTQNSSVYTKQQLSNLTNSVTYLQYQ